MNGIDPCNLSRADDVGNREIAEVGLRWTDTDGFISEPNMQSIDIDRGVHRNGPDAHFLRRANDPQRNFASISNEDFFEHVGPLVGLDSEEDLAKLHWASILDQNLANGTRHFALDFVHELHGFHDAERISNTNLISDLDEVR